MNVTSSRALSKDASHFFCIAFAKRIICSLVLPLALQLGIPRTAHSQDELPRSRRAVLKVEEGEFDFGTVTQGSVVKHDFPIKNVGNADLVIQKIVPSCGCTATRTTADIVPAGGVEQIHVEFDTSGFAGEKFKTVRVYTSDLDQPSMMLTLKGYIEPEISVEPKQIFFGEVVKGHDKEIVKQVKVTVKDPNTTKISGVKSFSKYLKVEELSNSGKGERVYGLHLTEDAPLGDLRDRVVVGLLGSKTASINIPIFASVKGRLRLSPQVLSFGVLEGSAPVRRVVKFENFGNDPVRLLSAKSDNGAISVTVKPIQEGKQYVAEVTVDPTRITGDLRASVELTTDDKLERLVTLSVFGVTPPKGK